MAHKELLVSVLQLGRNPHPHRPLSSLDRTPNAPYYPRREDYFPPSFPSRDGKEEKKKERSVEPHTSNFDPLWEESIIKWAVCGWKL